MTRRPQCRHCGEPSPCDCRDLPLARQTDPATSHEAAAAIRPQLGALQTRVLALIHAHPDRTATELAGLAFEADPRRVNRRISELLRDGRAEVSGTRPCDVTGRSAQTYRAARPGQQRLF
ncbi:MAG: winged helix-turn-helix domain-containing protein [Planctomycetota bacterium]